MAVPGESNKPKPRAQATPNRPMAAQSSTLSAGRIALGYALISVLWIGLSDAAVTFLQLNPIAMTIKGAVFVVVTAALLYITVGRLVEFVRLSSQERDQTAQLYRTLIEVSDEGICLLDESGRISFLNGRLAAMLGRPAEELQGKRLQDFIDEPYVLAEPGLQQSETRECRLRRDSEPKPWVLISPHPVLNAAGEVVRLLVTVTDITEGKQLQAPLRRSDSYLAPIPSVQEDVGEGSFAVAVRYGLTIVCVSIALGAALVLEKLQFRSAPIPLLLLAIAICSWYGGRGPGVLASVLSIVGFYWFFVEPVQTIYIYWSNVPHFAIFVVFAALISWFATVRQRVEAGLREQATLLDLSHDAIFVMDMEGVIKYWNRGAEERYGWPAEKAVGKVVHDLLQTVFPRPVDETKAELIRTGRWEGELVHTNERGTQMTVASRWSLQRDRHGAPFAILETNNDISERKRAEDAMSRLNRQLRAISNCNQFLLRATDEQSLLQEICRIICEDAGYRTAWVGYAQHDAAKSVRPVAWTGAEEGYFASLGISWADTEHGSGPTGTAIRSGKTCCIQDFSTDPRMAVWREGALLRDFRSAIALPLKDEHANAFGSLTIYSVQPNTFTAEEVGLVEELAADLAFGIVTLRSRAARQRTEEALRRSEAYLAEAQRLSHTGSFAFDVTGNNYVYISEECRRIFELDAQETPQPREAVSRVIHPEDWDRVNEDFEKLLRKKVDTPSEFRIVLPSGAVKHLHVIRHPVVNDGGEVVTILGTAIDITERKRAEEEVRNTAAQWQATFDAVHDLVLLLDKDFRILRANRAAAEFLGLPFDKIVGGRCYDLIHGTSTPPAECPLAKTRQSRRHEEAEVLAAKGGPWFSISVDPVFDPGGELTQVVHVARDITERKRAEQERERLRQLEADLAHINRVSVLGELAASIAHEVNQPLSGVVNNGSACLRWLAGETPNLEEARESARRIVRDGKRAGEVVARIRALATKVPAPKGELDLNATIRDVLALVRDEARRKDVAIETNFANGLSHVTGDQVQLQQVLLNLLMNGIEAMAGASSRERQLMISTRIIDADHVQVTVEDSGTGVDPAMMQRIFEPFYTTKADGMGMGLSVCRSIIQNHGGRLWATAKAGGGTAFHFTLPKYQEHAQALAV